MVDLRGLPKRIRALLSTLKFRPAPPSSNKKYEAEYQDGTRVRFGDKRYEHYRDRIGLFSGLDHGDHQRRQNFRSRFKRFLNGPYKSGGFLSYWLLW